MKKYLLVIVAVFSVFEVKAQGGLNYNDFGIGGGVSYVRGYTNLKRQYDHPAYSLNLFYNFTPYVPVSLEYQRGTLSGGGLTVDRDPSRRQYNNSYETVMVHADLQMGEIIDYQSSWFNNFLKNFYIGTGIGIISNHVTAQRTSLDDPTYIFPGVDQGLNTIIPLRAGFEFKIFGGFDQPLLGIDFGYRHNIVFGEGLDGYNDPTSKFRNNALDQYRQIYVGLRLNFGPESSYVKTIKRNNY